MGMGKADEFLTVAEMCQRDGHCNASASRSYYAMFHVAIVALEAFGIVSENWTHEGLQAAFARELIHRRKVYPAHLARYLTDALLLRVRADYGNDDVSMTSAVRALCKAKEFAKLVKEATTTNEQPED